MAGRTYNFFAGQRISRIEALSDGVFAIAMTLLVLDIKVPVGEFHTESDLIAAFWPLMPKFLAYLLGFMTLGIFWVGHATQFKFIARTDRHLTWLNIFFLMVISVFPFSTAFLSEYIHFKFAVGLYWLNIFLAGLTIYIHLIYARKANLLNEDADTEEVVKAIQNRIIIAQTLYLIAEIYWHKRNVPEAIRYYEMFLTKAPEGFAETAQARDRLKNLKSGSAFRN